MTAFPRDYHVHSSYSDGDNLYAMVRAARDAGLEAVGFADHCNVAERERMQELKCALGFNLDETYERRRRGLRALEERYGLRLYDAVEMDYDPRDEDAIRAFLARADFDYVVGSVHHLEDVNVHWEPYFERKSPDERRALVDTYFDHVVSMVESGLVDVVAHVDLVERNRHLAGLATREQYERVARALADAAAVPEVNAGRALREDGGFHPHEAFLAVLREHDVALTLGSDAHEPDELRERTPVVREFFAERDLEPVAVVDD